VYNLLHVYIYLMRTYLLWLFVTEIKRHDVLKYVCTCLLNEPYLSSHTIYSLSACIIVIHFLSEIHDFVTIIILYTMMT